VVSAHANEKLSTEKLVELARSGAADEVRAAVEEAHALGMVSKIFPTDELADKTLEFARRIAKVPTMAALLIKESVNQTQDNQGFYNSLNACFTMHQLNHSHWAWVHGGGFPVANETDGLPNWREAPPVVPAVKDKVRADD